MAEATGCLSAGVIRAQTRPGGEPSVAPDAGEGKRVTEGPSTFRHVAVVGPGAIGLCVAIRLARPDDGPQVTLIDRDADRARRLGGRALRLTSEAGDLAVRLPVCLRPPTPPDLVVLATKAHQAAAAAKAAADWIGDAVLLTLQNGLGVAREVAEALPDTTVLVGVTYQAANTVAEGEVHHAAGDLTHVGYEGRGPDATAEAVADLLRRSGLPAQAEADMTPVVWRKLLVNAAINPVAALAGVRNGEVAERSPLAALARRLAEEGEAVARAEGIARPEEPAADAVLATARATAENRCSMLQDLAAGRTTEIDYLNGALVVRAEAHGLDVPANRAVTTLVRLLSSPGEGKGN